MEKNERRQRAAAFPRFLSLSLALFAMACASFMVMSPPPARAFLEISTKAPYALLIDVNSGAILFEKNADTIMAPASMTKIVTLTLLFEEIKKGRVTLESKITVSKNAWQKGGVASGSSTMFLEPESTVTVRDLIMGVAVQSGNDASIVIAEYLGGTEENFAKAMTRLARKLKLPRSQFLNATGWPEPGHETTSREIAALTIHQIKNFPDLYPVYANKEYIWNGIAQKNRNRLLNLNIGVDGVKTARSSSSGYGIVASAEQQGRRLLLVINGLSSDRERVTESRRLLEWGFKAFKSYRLFEAGDPVEIATVWHGERPFVPLTVKEPLNVTITPEMREEMKVRIFYKSPLKAPLARGEKAGVMEVLRDDGKLITRVDLLIGQDVAQQGVFGRAFNTLEHVLFGGG